MCTTRVRTWLCLGLAGGLASPAPAAKQDFKVWNLEIQFINASKAVPEAEVKSKIGVWVATAERVYQRRPALKIHYSVVRQTTRDGTPLASLSFPSQAAYVSFMDQSFDNVAVTKTEGHLTVLIVDDLCIGTLPGSKKPDCSIGGISFFPHWTVPWSRKRGVVLWAGHASSYLLAHELGHTLSLKHTFEAYVGFNAQCNDDYRPKGKPEGKCNSCVHGHVLYDSSHDPDECNGPVNIMDYCTNAKNPDDEFLNTCQEDRAAHQRYTYMTDDGKTNYFRLKGLTGEAICEQDGDCEDGRYCDKGVVAGIGRNQCQQVKALGASCTRGEECASARCSGLRCAEANECTQDQDCGAGRYCSKGLAGIGRNTCEARLADGRGCTSDGQCGSGHCSPWRPQDGQESGICYTPGSKVAGAACLIDPECRAGKCNSNKKCVCRNDADCETGRWCDAGADLKENSCRPKLAPGEICGTVGEVGVGHRCRSGDCKASGLSVNLKCK